MVTNGTLDHNNYLETTLSPSKLKSNEQRILIYDRNKKTLTIILDIRAGFTDYAEKLKIKQTAILPPHRTLLGKSLQN